ncbi:MAG: RES family NAD+ phosphorylase [Magnetococcales bacterium]|nr:RES family NAD+ phosphorylase [Magnetococcales bacterium]
MVGCHPGRVVLSFPDTNRFRWRKSYRIIPSRYPPIDLFEGVSPPEDWELLAELEGMTNDRLRDEIGQIHLVPPERRVGGPGASWVMAPFTHINPHGSRFSDGSYGIYYAGKALETALRETIHHMGRFYGESNDPPHAQDFRTLIGRLDATLHDIRQGYDACHDPDDYQPGWALGKQLREGGSDGLVYRSVRHPGGTCLAAFWPDVVTIPIQGPHFQYHWNGQRIDKYFRYGEEEGDRWIPVDWTTD